MAANGKNEQGLRGRLIKWCRVPPIRWRQRAEPKTKRIARKKRRLETEASGMGHSEDEQDETKIRKAEDETGRGIRQRRHFQEHAER